jgi:hypothetical protein
MSIERVKMIIRTDRLEEGSMLKAEDLNLILLKGTKLCRMTTKLVHKGIRGKKEICNILKYPLPLLMSNLTKERM